MSTEATVKCELPSCAKEVKSSARFEVMNKNFCCVAHLKEWKRPLDEADEATRAHFTYNNPGQGPPVF